MNNTTETALTKTPAREVFFQEEIKEAGEQYAELLEQEDLQQAVHKKELMLKALIKYLGIVSYAANEVGIARRTHYKWLKADARYKASVELLNELAIDYSESRLFSYIQQSDLKAIMFMLRTRGSGRGYTMYKEKEAERQAAVFNFIVKDKETAEMIQQTKEKQ